MDGRTRELTDPQRVVATVSGRMEVVDLRCPEDPRTLLLKYHREVGRPPLSNNLMELHCRVCTKNARQFDSGVQRVVHRFDLAGVLVESLALRDD